jgi:hypothetical protein
MSSFEVTGLWWLWIATTIPTTFITIMSWWFYRRHKEKNMRPVQLWFKNDANPQSEEGETEKLRKPSIVNAFQDFLPSRRRKSSAPEF